jgi:Xaa-Pro aminopeptidase
LTELDKIRDVNAFHEKTARIRELIAEHNLDAIVLRRNPNLAWFIGGRVHVPSTLDLACLDMVILPKKVLAITNKIEAPRLIAEELPS